MTKRKFSQGYFKPKNVAKYLGNPCQIVYRSSWEAAYMSQLDKNPKVVGWSSESHVIPYISPKDEKLHRYFTDFFVKEVQDDGKIKKYLIEIKPFSQTIPPKSKKKKQLLLESINYAVNLAKWEAAEKYCVKYGYQFKILTEKDLGFLL